MSRISLYVDEDAMHSMLVRALVGRGVDVRTALDCGMINRSDDDHLQYATLQYATAEGRVLFSYNIADYCRIHDEVLRGGKSHAGILLTAQQRSKYPGLRAPGISA